MQVSRKRIAAAASRSHARAPPHAATSCLAGCCWPSACCFCCLGIRPTFSRMATAQGVGRRAARGPCWCHLLSSSRAQLPCGKPSARHSRALPPHTHTPARRPRAGTPTRGALQVERVHVESRGARRQQPLAHHRAQADPVGLQVGRRGRRAGSSCAVRHVPSMHGVGSRMHIAAAPQGPHCRRRRPSGPCMLPSAPALPWEQPQAAVEHRGHQPPSRPALHVRRPQPSRQQRSAP